MDMQEGRRRERRRMGAVPGIEWVSTASASATTTAPPPPVAAPAPSQLQQLQQSIGNLLSRVPGTRSKPYRLPAQEAPAPVLPLRAHAPTGSTSESGDEAAERQLPPSEGRISTSSVSTASSSTASSYSVPPPPLHLARPQTEPATPSSIRLLERRTGVAPAPTSPTAAAAASRFPPGPHGPWAPSSSPISLSKTSSTGSEEAERLMQELQQQDEGHREHAYAGRSLRRLSPPAPPPPLQQQAPHGATYTQPQQRQPCILPHEIATEPPVPAREPPLQAPTQPSVQATAQPPLATALPAPGVVTQRPPQHQLHAAMPPAAGLSAHWSHPQQPLQGYQVDHGAAATLQVPEQQQHGYLSSSNPHPGQPPVQLQGMAPAAPQQAAWLAAIQNASAYALAQALGMPFAGATPTEGSPVGSRTDVDLHVNSNGRYNNGHNGQQRGPDFGAGSPTAAASSTSPRASLPPRWPLVGKTPSASSIPYVPALPPPAPALPLPEPPSAAARRPLCDRIHNVTWAVARAFGFQAFNAREPAAAPPAAVASTAAGAQWVPATAFLAADHLEMLLVRNMMPRFMRDGAAASSGGGGSDGGKAVSAGGEEPDAGAHGDPEEQQQQEVAFARAVWELHSHIFLPYEGEAGWCRHVGLAPRLAGAESEVLGSGGADSGPVLQLLLCELALYFLLYSEAANLRHTPELLWFLFWAANTSPAMERMWRHGLAPEQQLDNARQRRLAMRNTLQAQLRAAQKRLGHDPAACRPERCAQAAAELSAQLPSMLPSLGLPPAAPGHSAARRVGSPAFSSSDAASDASLPCAPSSALFADLCCHGDGGFWTDCVVAPLFTVLAFEVDHMASAGQEVAHRLGYDDVNESMCRRDVVRRTLAELGVPLAAAEGGEPQCVWEAITRLGYPPARASEGGAEGDVERGATSGLRRRRGRTPSAAGARSSGGGSAPVPDDPRAFDPVRAAAFWADCVFVKTHRERRSWLSLLRAFYRVYSLQLVLLHATMAAAFAPGSLTALSSAVLTHALVAAAERTANWWLTRGTRDPLQEARARDSWVTAPPPPPPSSAEKADAEAGGEAAVSAPAAASAPAGPERSRLSDGGVVEERLERRRRVAVEGAPVWGVFGWIEWVLVAAGMVGLFALRSMGPPALQQMARSYWPLAAGGYVAGVVAHGLLTTRDGYCISLSSALRLPALFRASSQRAAAACWLSRPMAVGWRAAALTALFWLQVLAAKLAFDYWVIMRPMAGQVRLILRRNWLGCAGGATHYSVFGTRLPLRCMDADWLLVALRVAPFVLVCLVDTQIFYQLVLMAWGLVHGLVSLNLGIAGSWEGLRAEFHRAPLRWWARCMSGEANEAARGAAAAAQRRRKGALAAAAAAAGGCLGGDGTGALPSVPCSDDEDSDYGSIYSGSSPFRARSYSSLGSSRTSTASGAAPDASATPQHHHRAGRGRHSRRSGGPTRSPSPAGRTPSVASASECGASEEGSLSPKAARKDKKPKGGRDAAAAAELVTMLSGQGEEQMAQWMAFAAAWDAVVEDLRAGDLISDRERDNLLFTRLPIAATPMAGTACPDTGSSASGSGSHPTSLSGESASGSSDSGASRASSSLPSARPLRPILLPAFFYAGQVQRAVDTGSASPSQQLVLGELRAMLVWLGCQLRMLDGAQAAALLAAPCCPAALDAAHSRSREKGLAALRRLLAALQALTEPLPLTEAEARRRRSLQSEAAEALEGVLAAVEVEARAVVKAQLGGGKKGGKAGAGAGGQQEAEAEQDPQAAALALLDAVASLRSTLLGRPERLAAALTLLLPESQGCGDVPPASPSGAAAAALPAAPVCIDVPLLLRVLSTAAKMATLSSAAAQPTGAEARRILGFFVTSLANRQMAKPAPVAAMPSWTVLTPVYAEDVLFPLEARAAAEALGLAPGPAPRPGGKPGGCGRGEDAAAALPDLLTETEERVSVMAYLRSMFPKDWDNFKERLGGALGGLDLRAASEADFAEGGPLAEHALALQLWASYRGQLLARTVRGMAAYERAMRVLAAMDCPRPAGVGRREHAAAVEDVVAAKFTHVVASQLYGRHRRSSNLRERWLAESTDVLLESFPHLRVSYLDEVPLGPAAAAAAAVPGGPAPPPAHHYAVLIRGRRPGSEARWEGFVSQGGATAAAAAAAMASARAAAGGGRTEELYRVRLPYNRYSKRGVILGEGKPENQNHAVIFCFGEALQTIDMNQDNNLAEALKMRNLLAELAPERDTRAARRAQEELQRAVGEAAAAADKAAGVGAVATIPARRGRKAAAAADAAANGTSAAASLPAASEYKRLLGALRSAERPVAVVGFREWVFSDKAGTLGSFAASSEFAFSTLVQRTMAYPANVRLHYGHPDAFNKLFVMTRGGVAKASRQLHVSEDIFGGMNHSLRGGRIKFREYTSCGKGRDMGFDSINAFESKISAGFGEVALSRDLLRMATRLDLWRCLHLYHSLAGAYFNTWLVMGSVYAHVYALLFFALARAAVYRTVTYYPSPPPPPPGTPSIPVQPNAPSPPPGVIRESLAYDTIRIEHVLQLGLLSLLPYVAEVALEHGMVRGALAALAQVLSGSFTFFIFKQQTTATALHKSMLYGGATYVATGRGFSITSSSFIKLFANYGRSHIALGFELAAMAVAVAVTNDCARCSYGGLTWGTWLAALSLILAPCWFNPMAFSPAKVKRDMHAWAAWLRGEADRELGVTWHQWNRAQLAHSRDEATAQTDRRLNVLQCLALRAVPPALLCLAAASRLSLRLDKLPGLPPLLRSSWALFFAASALMWAVMGAATAASRRARQLSDTRRVRLWAFWVGAGGASACALFLVGLSRFYSGNGLTNLCLLLYANANLLLALHRALEHVAPRSRTARRLVDGGYRLQDSCLGWVVLGLLGAMSMAGVVGRIQTTMLFNVTFARSVRRGSLVKTIGTVKAERGQQAALLGLVLDGEVASSGSGGSGGHVAGKAGGRVRGRA